MAGRLVDDGARGYGPPGPRRRLVAPARGQSSPGSVRPALSGSRLSRRFVHGLLALLPAVISCGESPEPLLGEWVSVAAETGRMTYVFEEDGRSRWVLDSAEGPDTFAVAYRIDYGRSPIHLDVGPWSTGPLAGRTLYGIVEMRGPDRFVVDFEPGDPGGEGAARPARFSNQSVTFVRKLN